MAPAWRLAPLRAACRTGLPNWSAQLLCRIRLPHGPAVWAYCVGLRCGPAVWAAVTAAAGRHNALSAAHRLHAARQACSAPAATALVMRQKGLPPKRPAAHWASGHGACPLHGAKQGHDPGPACQPPLAAARRRGAGASGAKTQPLHACPVQGLPAPLSDARCQGGPTAPCPAAGAPSDRAAGGTRAVHQKGRLRRSLLKRRYLF